MYFDIYILSYLMEAPQYGYGIKKKLADSVGACASISNNTLYPILRKYEKMGAAVKSVEQKEGGQERFVYTLTDAGHKAFVDILWNFPDSMINSRDEFCTRLSFFPYLSKQARIRLLDLREAFVKSARSKVERRDFDPPAEPHKAKMLEFFDTVMSGEEELIRYFRERIDDPCLLTSEGYFV